MRQASLSVCYLTSLWIKCPSQAAKLQAKAVLQLAEGQGQAILHSLLSKQAHHEYLLAECNLLQAGAAVPAPTPQKPSWLQAALSHFVMLRKRAVELEGNGELLCMPVVITASTRSSASSLQGTASGHSLVKDVHVQPLTEMQMQAVIFDLAKRNQRPSGTQLTSNTAAAPTATDWWQP